MPRSPSKCKQTIAHGSARRAGGQDATATGMNRRMRSRHTSTLLMIQYRNPWTDRLEQKREGGTSGARIHSHEARDTAHAYDSDSGSCRAGSSFPYSTCTSPLVKTRVSANICRGYL
jgi:hypothetical protein